MVYGDLFLDNSDSIVNHFDRNEEKERDGGERESGVRFPLGRSRVRATCFQFARARRGAKNTSGYIVVAAALHPASLVLRYVFEKLLRRRRNLPLTAPDAIASRRAAPTAVLGVPTLVSRDVSYPSTRRGKTFPRRPPILAGRCGSVAKTRPRERPAPQPRPTPSVLSVDGNRKYRCQSPSTIISRI